MEMIGRWTWNAEKMPDAIDNAVNQDESDVMTMEDSLTYMKGMEELSQLEKDAEKARKAAESASGKNGSKKIHWIPIAISGAVAVAGGVMAAVFNNKAKSASEETPMNPAEYNDQHDRIQKNQQMRNVSLGIMAAGLVGIGVTFLF